LFILGLCFGSFANVLIDRTQRGESIRGNSKCDFCGYKLKWYDNIPIMSFLFLKGRCRKCGKKLSWQYPLVEFFTGVVFVLTYFALFAEEGVVLFDWVFWMEAVYYFLVIYILFVVLVWDLKYMIIPDFIVLIGISATFLFEIYRSFEANCFLQNIDCPLLGGLLGALAIGGFFRVLYFVSGGRWIGGGDVKIGFWLGFLVKIKMAYFFILFAYLSGALFAVFLLIFSKKKMKSQIPFGPFLVFSSYLIIFGKDVILEIWNKFLL
jgi:prepilin signal peptidase PulO-like enzyme (type II secretory pathway)